MGVGLGKDTQDMVSKRRVIAKRALAAFVVMVVLAVGACAWYVNDYYHADEAALFVVADKGGVDGNIEVRELPSGDIAFVPADPKAGLVFYPGAKVQPEAYAPLMNRCAERGMVCVVVKPLFNLAIIDMDAAAGVTTQFPEVTHWVIAGHSMGGVAAADYLSRHEDEFDSIVFLASYPSVDLAEFHGKVLSIIGSNDQVLSREKYESAREKLPSGARELIIEGGNHAGFGDYGEQSGDGKAAIEREEQQFRTAEAIASLADSQA